MRNLIGHQVVIIIQDDVLAGTVRYQPLYGTLQALSRDETLARVTFTSGARLVVPAEFVSEVNLDARANA